PSSRPFPYTTLFRSRERFPLPGIVLDGSHLKLEGLTVSGAPGDGIRVSGEDNALEALLVTDCDGAAISTAGADGLAIDHCTLSRSEEHTSELQSREN